MMKENGYYCEGSYVFYADYFVGIISRLQEEFIFMHFRYVNKKARAVAVVESPSAVPEAMFALS